MRDGSELVYRATANVAQDEVHTSISLETGGGPTSNSARTGAAGVIFHATAKIRMHPAFVPVLAQMHQLVPLMPKREMFLLLCAVAVEVDLIQCLR